MRVLKNSIRKICNTKINTGYFSTVGDFNYIATREKIQTVMFGPDGRNFHGPDEYVRISTVIDTAKVLVDTILRLLGG